MSVKLELLEELALVVMERGNDQKHPLYMEVLKDYADKTALKDPLLTDEDLSFLENRGERVWDICINILALGMRKGETQALVFMAKLLAKKIDEEIAKEKDKI